MEEMEVQTRWNFTSHPGESTGDYNPQVLIDYPGLVRVTNRSINPEDPNYDPDASIYRIAGEPSLLNTIEADPNYPVLPGTRQPYSG